MCSMGKFGSPHKLCIINGLTLYIIRICIFFLFWGACHVCSMGKFGSPHKLCILRTLEFVYFSFFGVTLLGPNG